MNPGRRDRSVAAPVIACLFAVAVWLWGGTSAQAQNVREDLFVTNGKVISAVVSGNRLYIGGIFTRVGPAAGGFVPIDGTSGAPLAGFAKVAGQVFAVAPDGAGGWFIGGIFTAVNGISRSNIAHILANHTLSPWNPNASGEVDALAVSGGTVYAGGNFLTIGGQTRNYIAALDATTGLATAWDPNASFTVFSLAVSGGTVYAGGDFFTIGGQTRFGIAALDATTGLATAWDPDADTTVLALAVSGGTVYVGGYINTIGGQTRNYIAALDATTGLATAWDPNASYVVFGLAVSEGTVYAGGGFSTIGGQTRNYIAALDATTGLATTWDPNANRQVFSLALSGGTVYAGGDFARIKNLPQSSLAAIDACSNEPDGTPCNDGNACTTGDVCSGGACTAGPADLVATETDSADPIVAGQRLTYTVTVTNGGPNPAASASLGTATPANTTFVSITPPAGWSCMAPSTGGTGPISCSKVCASSSEVAVFTIAVKVNQCAGDGAVLAGPVTVSSTSPDPNLGNNTATETSLVMDPGTCDDGDCCTVDDFCQAHACIGGAPMDCNDCVACTDDSACNPATGCVHANICTFAALTTLLEVSNLTFRPDKVTLSWNYLGAGTYYDVLRGLVSGLPVGPVGGSADESCLAISITATSKTDSVRPAMGAAFWYLVRGRDSCGAGTYGTRSNGTPNITASCP